MHAQFDKTESAIAILAVLNNLGIAKAAQKRYEEAEETYWRAIDMCKTYQGEEHPDVARIYYNLARLYVQKILSKLQADLDIQKKEYEDIETLLLSALYIQEKHLGAEHPETALTLHELASIYLAQDNKQQAEPLYQRLLELSKKDPDKQMEEKFPHLSSAIEGLRSFLYDPPSYEQLETLFQRSINNREQELDPSHPDVITIKKQQAYFLHSVGNHVEAEAIERELNSLEVDE